MTAGAYVPKGAPTPREAVPFARSEAAKRLAKLGLVALAGLGAFAGIYVLFMHLTTDPLSDVRAYYDAARRLNAGRPLYPPTANPDAADFYRYPPLLAIALRPLALLPYQAFALAWEALVVASFAALIARLGGGMRTWVAVGILGLPIGWCLAIGQAQVPLTLLVAIGQPWSIALAGQLKLFPVLIALWWVGRRDWQSVAAFAAWTLLFVLAQVVLDSRSAASFIGTLGAEQIGHARNISPFVVSPILWAVLLAAGLAAAIVFAPKRWGWAIAVALGTLSPPRLIVYMLTTLLAAIREPRPAVPETERDASAAVDVAESYVRSAR